MRSSEPRTRKARKRIDGSNELEGVSSGSDEGPKLIENPKSSLRREMFGVLSVEELAAALDRSPQTIRNWVAQRVIPFAPLGNETVFFQESVREWLQAKEFKPHGSQ